MVIGVKWPVVCGQWVLCAALVCLLWGCVGGPQQRPTERAALKPERAVAHIFYADFDSPEHRSASGTGFVIDGDGLMVTAAHVVAEDKIIEVRFSGFEGQEDEIFYPARVITVDEERDVALLKLDVGAQASTLTPAALAASDSGIGAPVSIFGYPESNVVGMEMRRSSGMISAWRQNPLDRDDKTRMLELEAKIEPGNSGSPVFNQQMEVVGVVSSRWETTDSYALAAPVSVVHDLLQTRYEDDLRRAQVELEALPEAYIIEIRKGRDLALTMRDVFPVGSEGAQRVAALEAGMTEALDLAAQGVEALERQEIAVAWRHLQLMRHKALMHRQDVAVLRAARKAIIAGQE